MPQLQTNQEKENIFYWPNLFSLDSAVVKTHKLFSQHLFNVSYISLLLEINGFEIHVIITEMYFQTFFDKKKIRANFTFIHI